MFVATRGGPGPEKLAPYYECLRADALESLPEGASTVLSVGCAGGRTEAELVKRGVTVVGIEMNPEAAAMARSRGLTVLQGNASEMDVNVGCAPYDYIIYADVLEHLPDPAAVLARHVESLRSGGSVYITVPNFRNYAVFWELFVKGQIIYKDAGILDRTHVRITTRKGVLQWLREANLELLSSHYVIPGRRNRLISLCFLGLAREFIANQIAVTARKPDDRSSRGRAL